MSQTSFIRHVNTSYDKNLKWYHPPQKELKKSPSPPCLESCSMWWSQPTMVRHPLPVARTTLPRLALTQESLVRTQDEYYTINPGWFVELLQYQQDTNKYPEVISSAIKIAPPHSTNQSVLSLERTPQNICNNKYHNISQYITIYHNSQYINIKRCPCIQPMEKGRHIHGDITSL